MPIFTGNQPLFITFDNIKNPISVRNIGAFTVDTFTIIGFTEYAVDSTTKDNLVTTVAGGVTKGADITSSSMVTYYAGRNGIYNFNFNFENTVPLGGFIRVNLPDEMVIGEARLLASYCYRIDFASAPISLRCT